MQIGKGCGRGGPREGEGRWTEGSDGKRRSKTGQWETR